MSVDPNACVIKSSCEECIGAVTTFHSRTTFPNGREEEQEINNSKIIGNVMEDIVYSQIAKRISTLKKGPPGQKPDFINSVSEHMSYDYEMKCFNGSKNRSPNFDIGTITGFLGDISKENGVQKKLDVKYLIFEYKINKETASFTVTGFWMLSVCDICCGYQPRKIAKPIGIGGSAGIDIRPAGKGTWTDEKNREKRNPTNFLDRIEKLIQSEWYKVDELKKQQKLKSIQTQRKAIGF